MDKSYLDLKFQEISRKIDSIVEVNNELIQQNIKLSDKVFKNIVSPEIESSPSNLFYEIQDSFVMISGPGTYESKDKIKELKGEWYGALKCWKCKITQEEVKQKFPHIKEKTH
jgi:hypothetical protein